MLQQRSNPSIECLWQQDGVCGRGQQWQMTEEEETEEETTTTEIHVKLLVSRFTMWGGTGEVVFYIRSVPGSGPADLGGDKSAAVTPQGFEDL